MIKSDFLARVAGGFIYYRWHPEVALRYLPIVDMIKSIGLKVSVLEVGSDGLGITPYLKSPIVGADIHFNRPFHPLLKRVKADATRLPFDEHSFDVVISVDMIEHLDRYKRKKAIEEMARVAKRLIVIAVPSGAHAQAEDALLYKEYKKIHKEGYQFYDEQIYFGLPKTDDMKKIIESSLSKLGNEFHLSVFGNETIALHRFLMRGWMKKNPLTQLFFRKVLLLAIPFMRHLNTEPTYRKIFQVTISKAAFVNNMIGSRLNDAAQRAVILNN